MNFRKFLRAVLIVGIVIVAIMGEIVVRCMKEKYDSVSVRLEEGITREALLKDLEMEKEGNSCKLEQVTAFSETRQNVKAESTNRYAATLVYQMYGDVNKAMQVDLIWGAPMLVEDNSGCMLTDELAYELFGSIDVIGLEVLIEDETYLVRGVVSGSEKAIFYEKADDQATFDCLEFVIKDPDGGYYANLFTQIYGLPKAIIIESNYLVNLLSNFALLPFLIAFIFLALKGNLWLKEINCKYWIRGLGIGFGVILLCLIIKVFGYFPDRLIPTWWSNFSHYSRFIEEIADQINSLRYAKPIVREVVLKKEMVTVVMLCVASLFGGVYVLHYAELGLNRIFQYVRETKKCKESTYEA